VLIHYIYIYASYFLFVSLFHYIQIKNKKHCVKIINKSCLISQQCEKKREKKIENRKIISNTIYILGNLDIACSHTRSIVYLADALEENCGFPGVSTTM